MEKLLSTFEHLSKLEIVGIFAFAALLIAFCYALIRMALIKSIEASYKAPANRFKSEIREEDTQAAIDDIKNDAVPSFLILASAAIIYFFWGTGF